MTAAVKTNSNAIPHNNNGFDSTPMLNSEARSVRAAKAVPIWQATIPTKVTVVA